MLRTTFQAGLFDMGIGLEACFTPRTNGKAERFRLGGPPRVQTGLTRNNLARFHN
jgi:hypothetical protein